MQPFSVIGRFSEEVSFQGHSIGYSQQIFSGSSLLLLCLRGGYGNDGLTSDSLQQAKTFNFGNFIVIIILVIVSL